MVIQIDKPVSCLGWDHQPVRIKDWITAWRIRLDHFDSESSKSKTSNIMATRCYLFEATDPQTFLYRSWYPILTVKRFGSILCSCNHRSDLRIGANANPSPSHSKPLSRNLDLVSQIRGGLHLVIGTWEQSLDPWATWAPWERRPARWSAHVPRTFGREGCQLFQRVNAKGNDWNPRQNSSFEDWMARSPAPGFGWNCRQNSGFEDSMTRSPAPAMIKSCKRGLFLHVGWSYRHTPNNTDINWEFPWPMFRNPSSGVNPIYNLLTMTHLNFSCIGTAST